MYLQEKASTEGEIAPQEEGRPAFVMPDDQLTSATEVMLHRDGEQRVVVAEPLEHWHPRGDGSENEMVIKSPYAAYADGDRLSALPDDDVMGDETMDSPYDAIRRAVTDHKAQGGQGFYLWVHGDSRDNPDEFVVAESMFPLSFPPHWKARDHFLVGAVLHAGDPNGEGAVPDLSSRMEAEVGQLVAWLGGSVRAVTLERLEATDIPGLKAWHPRQELPAWDSDDIPELAAALTDGDGDDPDDWCWFQRNADGEWEVSLSVPAPSTET